MHAGCCPIAKLPLSQLGLFGRPAVKRRIAHKPVKEENQTYTAMLFLQGLGMGKENCSLLNAMLMNRPLQKGKKGCHIEAHINKKRNSQDFQIQ